MRVAFGVLATVAVATLGWTSPAQAHWELVDGERGYLELKANLQLMSAYVDMRGLKGIADVPGLREEASLGGAVGRMEWYGQWGSRADLTLHNRFYWQSSSLPEEFVGQGLGASAGVERRVDTSVDLLESEEFRFTHDLDRAVLGLYFHRMDIYLGRQAIRWGVSDLFAVADRFAPLSPFELDTIQRRGIDAARAVTHLSPRWELDMVVADRGSGQPLSLGTRVEYFGARADVYAGMGRFWERFSAMGGLSLLAGNWKVFAEAEGLWNIDEEELERPRTTIGAQRVSMDWQMGLEYHYNGLGVDGTEGYGAAMAREELARGESYLMGRHYVGATGMYLTQGSWRFRGGMMMNIFDPSAIFFPAVEYEIEDQLTITAGAYGSVGERGEIDVEATEEGELESTVVVPSEFGASSNLYFLQMTAFF